jgi:hypothetical protein
MSPKDIIDAMDITDITVAKATIDTNNIIVKKQY